MKYRQEEHSNNLEYVANCVVKYSCTNASNYSVLYGCTRLLRVPVRVEVKVITTWPEWTLSPVISQTLALSGRRWECWPSFGLEIPQQQLRWVAFYTGNRNRGFDECSWMFLWTSANKRKFSFSTNISLFLSCLSYESLSCT